MSIKTNQCLKFTVIYQFINEEGYLTTSTEVIKVIDEDKLKMTMPEHLYQIASELTDKGRTITNIDIKTS